MRPTCGRRIRMDSTCAFGVFAALNGDVETFVLVWHFRYLRSSCKLSVGLPHLIESNAFFWEPIHKGLELWLATCGLLFQFQFLLVVNFSTQFDFELFPKVSNDLL